MVFFGAFMMVIMGMMYVISLAMTTATGAKKGYEQSKGKAYGGCT
jgi:hypothetical protein